MKSSPLRVETKFVTMEEMKDIIHNDKVIINVRYELYKKIDYL